MSYFPITDPTLIFFVVLLIILFAPIVMSKLRIPHIIGMVLAGMVMGHYGLDILERDNSFELFGRVGLYYIMFLAGLETDIENVKRSTRRIVAFGLLTCFIPFGLTYLMATTLLHYAPAASFLLGCVMASNTLIAYPIVTRYGLQRHGSVSLSVGASMLALFLALILITTIGDHTSPLMSLLDSLHVPNTPLVENLVLFLSLPLYIVVLLLAIPRLTRYFLRRYSDSVMQYIFVMAIMFLSAAVCDLIGLEGIIGAFLSGLILNRYIPHVSPLMNRIEFIGNALFIPYFLIGVGMLINVRTLADGPYVLWVVFLITFVGTFGKAVAAYLSALLFRLTKADGHMMFGLTSAHAAGAIAIVMLGMKMEYASGQPLVTDDMLNGVVMMILVTCIISSLMTQHASQQITLTHLTPTSHHPSPNTHPSTPNTQHPTPNTPILICVKYPEIAPQLLTLANLINHPGNRDMVALNVVYDDEHSAANSAAGHQLLEQLQRQAAATDIRLQTQVRLATNIANGIKHAFRESACSEIIMGMHVHTEHNPKFWGEFIQSLYNGLNRQIILTRFVQPLTTLRRIQVAVPSRAEFEPGFHRWLERLSLLASQLDCRIQFHGRQESLALIAQFINNEHPSVRAEYTPMAHWNELPRLASQIAEDHLFVVVTARKGTISYKNALDRLPDELQRHYSGKNLIIIFPDQYGVPKEDTMSFTEAQHHEESSIYDWLLRKLEHLRTP